MSDSIPEIIPLPDAADLLGDEKYQVFRDQLAQGLGVTQEILDQSSPDFGMQMERRRVDFMMKKFQELLYGKRG